MSRLSDVTRQDLREIFRKAASNNITRRIRVESELQEQDTLSYASETGSS
ncbi:uncharacterized protein ARMOST_13764 [Armillaria ostoyae]|uniref:Uncharacterized protein n=1 Tax=Armillaria ostoyae TaxID=47428 RepID=A0A284RNQ8_ARMOS|nr:uncharacterized protein ARMOST_13764 [Armillaria ostoyae]